MYFIYFILLILKLLTQGAYSVHEYCFTIAPATYLLTTYKIKRVML